MVVLFEDSHAADFYPVGLTRHVSELLVGAMTLRARVERLVPGHLVLFSRPYLRDYYRSRGETVYDDGGAALFINARAVVTEELVAAFPADDEWVMSCDGVVVAARLEARSAARLDATADTLNFASMTHLPVVHAPRVRLYERLWEMLDDNGARLRADFDALGGGIEGDVADGVVLVAPESMRIAGTARIRAGAILDAGEGPIIIDADAEIMPGAVLLGPCFVGRGSRVKVGAKICENTSIGPACKVGGEVEDSILLGYSNKQHDGFLGHSYLGSWVNLGADTNTSDLKNNYATIRVTLDGAEIDTGRMFLGSLIGDHAKTGINTMLNTGTVIGVASNIFGGGFPPKSIPSFSWGGSDGLQAYRVDRAIDVARTVMARRNVECSESDVALLRYLASRNELAGLDA